MSADLNNAIINLGKVIQDSRNPSAYDMQLMKTQAVKQQAEDNLISQSNIQDMQNLITESKGTLDPDRIDSLMQVIEGRYADSEDRVTLDTKNKAIATLVRKKDVINGGLIFNKRQDELNEKLFGKVEFNEAGEVIGGGKFTSAALQGIHTDASTVDDMIRSEIFNQVDYGTFDAETKFEGYVDTIKSQLEGLNRMALKDFDKSNKQFDIDDSLPEVSKTYLKEAGEQIQLGQTAKVVSILDDMLVKTGSSVEMANRQMTKNNAIRLDKELEEKKDLFRNELDEKLEEVSEEWQAEDFLNFQELISYASDKNVPISNITDDMFMQFGFTDARGKNDAKKLIEGYEHRDAEYNFGTKFQEAKNKRVVAARDASLDNADTSLKTVQNSLSQLSKKEKKTLKKLNLNLNRQISTLTASGAKGKDIDYESQMDDVKGEIDKIVSEVFENETHWASFGYGNKPERYADIIEHIKNNRFEEASIILSEKAVYQDWAKDIESQSGLDIGFADTEPSLETGQIVINALAGYLQVMHQLQQGGHYYNLAYKNDSKYQRFEKTSEDTTTQASSLRDLMKSTNRAK